MDEKPLEICTSARASPSPNRTANDKLKPKKEDRKLKKEKKKSLEEKARQAKIQLEEQLAALKAVPDDSMSGSEEDDEDAGKDKEYIKVQQGEVDGLAEKLASSAKITKEQGVLKDETMKTEGDLEEHENNPVIWNHKDQKDWDQMKADMQAVLYTCKGFDRIIEQFLAKGLPSLVVHKPKTMLPAKFRALCLQLRGETAYKENIIAENNWTIPYRMWCKHPDAFNAFKIWCGSSENYKEFVIIYDSPTNSKRQEEQGRDVLTLLTNASKLKKDQFTISWPQNRSPRFPDADSFSVILESSRDVLATMQYNHNALQQRMTFNEKLLPEANLTKAQCRKLVEEDIQTPMFKPKCDFTRSKLLMLGKPRKNHWAYALSQFVKPNTAPQALAGVSKASQDSSSSSSEESDDEDNKKKKKKKKKSRRD